MSRPDAALPAIEMTGDGDVPLAVRAMRAGAFDFVEKPFESDMLAATVESALRASTERRETAGAGDGDDQGRQLLAARAAGAGAAFHVGRWAKGCVVARIGERACVP